MQVDSNLVQYALNHVKKNFLEYKPHKKQRIFHDAGKTAKERMFLAGNRTGKTYCGVIECAMHLTGRYPTWWDGKRFTRPIKCWSASVTTGLTEEVLENAYLDVIADDLILSRDKQRHYYTIQYIDGGTSELSFKSYEQGRAKFQAAKLDLIHLDEEPTQAIYGEALMRTMSTDINNQGILILTMTPLLGLTNLINQFMDGKTENVIHEDKKFYVMASWDDNPHLLQEEKEILIKALPPHEREAREKGIPSMGHGMVYPVSEMGVTVAPFEIPKHWNKIFALDFGWTNPTACLFGAYDRDNDVLYLYAEYYIKERTPQQHAHNLSRYGIHNMSGVYDPAGEQKSQKDGGDIVSLYKDAGITNIKPANNSKEEGIMKTLQRFQDGKLKIFSTLKETLKEFRMHTRMEDGKVRKGNDHLMDCMRYMVMSGIDNARFVHHYHDYYVRPEYETTIGVI